MSPTSALGPELVDQLARMTHRAYVDDVVAGRVEPGRTALERWEDLDDGARNRNRAHVMGLINHLASLGYRVVPRDLAPPDRIVDQLSDEQLDRLAEAEHSRWMDHEIGSESAPSRHSDLAPWDQLAPGVRAKDRLALSRALGHLAAVGLLVVTDEAARPTDPPEEQHP